MFFLAWGKLEVSNCLHLFTQTLFPPVLRCWRVEEGGGAMGGQVETRVEEAWEVMATEGFEGGRRQTD